MAGHEPVGIGNTPVSMSRVRRRRSWLRSISSSHRSTGSYAAPSRSFRAVSSDMSTGGIASPAQPHSTVLSFDSTANVTPWSMAHVLPCTSVRT